MADPKPTPSNHAPQPEPETMIERPFRLILVLLLLILPPAGRAASYECLIEPMQVVELRAPLEGLIERIEVDRGAAVRQGQVLVVLDTGVDRARLALARYKAEMRGALQAAASRLDFSSKKLRRQEDLFRKQVVSALEHDESEADRNLAAAEKLVAEDNTQVARLEVREQEEILRLKTIRSPFDGVVLERRHHPGELARSDDQYPLLKLARIDPLYAEVILPAALLGQLRAGDDAEVLPEAGPIRRLPARVAVVDPVVDGASGTFGVRLELKNPDLRVPAGIHCRAEFRKLAAETAEASQNPAPRPSP